MNKLQIIIPLAGRGTRFQQAGYKTPKPLIEVDGLPMFMHAVNSFDAYEGEKKLFFITREDQEERHNFSSIIKEFFPSSEIIVTKNEAIGAATSCLYSEDKIDPNLPLVVMDCDISFNATNYFLEIEKAIETKSIDGIIPTFISDRNTNSYIKEKNDLVVKIAEKEVISNKAVAGAYFFTEAKSFFKYAKSLLEKGLGPKMKEYYVSYVYALMIEDHKKIKAVPLISINSFGTPEELEITLRK